MNKPKEKIAETVKPSDEKVTDSIVSDDKLKNVNNDVVKSDLFNSHKFNISSELDTITKQMITDFITSHKPMKTRIVNVTKESQITFKFDFAVTKKHKFYCFPVATFRYLVLQKNNVAVKPVGTCESDHKTERKLLNFKFDKKSNFNYLTFYNSVGKFNYVIETSNYYILKLPKFHYVLCINKTALTNVKLNTALVKFIKLTF